MGHLTNLIAKDSIFQKHKDIFHKDKDDILKTKMTF
jgi:hypothetical protein